MTEPPPSLSSPVPTGGPVRRLAAPSGVLAAVIAAFGYVGAVDPNEPGHYPVCPLLRLTGLYCPGCGGLRSAHALVHGDLPTALRDNALAVLCVAVFVVGWVVWCVRCAGGGRRGRSARSFAPRVWQAWALLTLVIVFSVVRNFPFGGLLTP